MNTVSDAVRSWWKAPGFVFAVGLGFLFLWTLFYAGTRPVYSEEVWTGPDGVREKFHFPFVKDSAALGKHKVEFVIHLKACHPSRFKLHADDRIERIVINGEDVRSRNFPVTYDKPKIFNFLKDLKPGPNTVSVEIDNHFAAAHLYWYPALSDPWVWLLLALAGGSVVFLLRWINLAFPQFLGPWEAVILSGALFLRLIYVIGTPFFVRAYDAHGHMAYIHYVATHLRLPPHDLGWETFQPPLYYILFGLLERGVAEFSGGPDLILAAMQAAAFGVSGLTVLCALWITRILFPEHNDSLRLWLLGIVGVFPGIVFYASRINNDTLFGLVSFVWLGALLVFWRTRLLRWWIVMAILTGVGLLTKGNALVFLPAALLALAVTKDISWAKKGLLSLSLLAITLAISGWFLAQRALESRDSSTFVVGNIRFLDPNLRFEPKFFRMLALNPVEMVREPFTWPDKKNPRRDCTLEYFFKSAFFGEWRLPQEFRLPARVMVICALLLLPFLVWGIWRVLRHGDSIALPLLICMLGFLGAQMTWILKEPFTCSQDFRYFVVLIVPLGYFLIRGISESTPRLWIAGQCLLGFLVLNTVLFLLLLSAF